MDGVVVLEPSRELLEDGDGVRPGVHPGVVAFSGQKVVIALAAVRPTRAAKAPEISIEGGQQFDVRLTSNIKPVMLAK